MAFVSFINVLWEVIIWPRASSKSTFFSSGGLLYYGCSSSHSSDCSDYSGYLSNPGLDSDSDSGTYSDMYYLHIVHIVVHSTDSHIVLALLSFS